MRPDKKTQAIIAIRNKNIIADYNKGYPRDYICEYYKISESVLSRIIQKDLEKV